MNKLLHWLTLQHLCRIKNDGVHIVFTNKFPSSMCFTLSLYSILCATIYNLFAKVHIIFYFIARQSVIAYFWHCRPYNLDRFLQHIKEVSPLKFNRCVLFIHSYIYVCLNVCLCHPSHAQSHGNKTFIRNNPGEYFFNCLKWFIEAANVFVEFALKKAQEHERRFYFN